jgi:hypothetical protein
MPHEMDEVFRGAGASLFPEQYRDLETECSCPDWSNPCKHIAAVYYLLGEEFDRDPFLIFRMRGMTREEFLALLGESGAKQRPAAAETLPPDPRAPPCRGGWGSFPSGAAARGSSSFSRRCTRRLPPRPPRPWQEGDTRPGSLFGREFLRTTGRLMYTLTLARSRRRKSRSTYPCALFS